MSLIGIPEGARGRTAHEGTPVSPPLEAGGSSRDGAQWKISWPPLTRRAVSPAWVVLVVSLWMALAGNAALWRQLGQIGIFGDARGWAFAGGMLVMIWSMLVALLGLLAWRPTLKPVATLLIVTTALASHFMLSYHIVIDPGMVTNVLQTDMHEAADLANARLAVAVLLLALLPIWLLWRQPVAYGSLSRQGWRNPLLALGAVGVLAAALLASFQTLAPVMRNHREMRYLINPLSSVYSLARVAIKPLQRGDVPMVRTGEDAHLGPLHPGQARPPLLLLVLGETGRAGNFGLNGYARDTTPELAREPVASFRNAWSCGTSTAASVPCMFSNLTRARFANREAEHEGLLDVLQRAGLAVLWLDNQAGCKGVCDRVPSAHVSPADVPASLCPNGECLDGAMLEGLDARLAALDPARQARGTVLVLHQMGSHGPAYSLRSPAAQKRFLPECTKTALQDCSKESVVNAYDNSIAYTDHFLAQTIAWLRRRQDRDDTAMLYVADHGESLGENNLFLHGMPYALAPDVQKRVPWITWVSPGYERRTGMSLACLRRTADVEISHDHYFHSVLGLMDVQTAAYQPGLDAYAACRATR